MADKLTEEEVAVLIRARQLLKQEGLPPDADVQTICRHAGISRKTGYQWVKKVPDKDQETQLRCELDQLKTEHKDLEKRFADALFENEGRKIAWEIHDVEKLIAEKKSTMNKAQKKKR